MREEVIIDSLSVSLVLFMQIKDSIGGNLKFGCQFMKAD